MPQTITVHVDELVAAAEREVETLSAADAIKLHGRPDVVLVDIRDIRELNREGRVPGAFHCPRGLLEFWVDPQSHYHKPVFAEDKRFVFFCAGGLRSAARGMRCGCWSRRRNSRRSATASSSARTFFRCSTGSASPTR